jgi:hypothetical protein
MNRFPSATSGMRSERIAACFAAVAVVCLAMACQSCGREATPTSPTLPPSFVRLEIAGDPLLTTIGETRQLNALAVFSDGSQRDVTDQTTWSSAQPLVVTISPGGLLTVLQFGESLISARYQGTYASVTVRPSPPGTFVIAGWIREPGEGGVDDVTVTDVGSHATTQTDSTGRFTLVALPAPEAHLRLDKVNYEPAEFHATQTSATAALQQTIRVHPGDTVTPPRFAPNDFVYIVDNHRCFPCRLVRLVPSAPGMFHVRVTWSQPQVTFSLWADGAVSRGSATELVADVPVRGETIVYLEMNVPVNGGTAFHVPVTIEASVQ